MIEVSADLKRFYPRAFELARKDKFRIVWLRPDLIYCARRQKGHGEYLIRVFVIPRVNGDPQVKMVCNSIHGGKCKWGEHHPNEPCSHIAAVIERSKKKPNKKERKEAA